jgi:peptide-methionine (S)-S-oxide reductase
MATEIATFAGGCFWCIEAAFNHLRGVQSALSGYMGGEVLNPSYAQVCQGNTGHAEVVQVTFDPRQISYADLLSVFFALHDPTTLNYQGQDVGTQYRSAIFVHSPEQAKIVLALISQLNTAQIWRHPIVTQVSPAVHFYVAEDAHQRYFARHPEEGYCRVVIAPKLAKFRQLFTRLTQV